MRVHALSPEDRSEIKSWNYSQELAAYSGEEIAPGNPAFFAVYDGNEFMGFGVTGFDAIVQGMELNSTTLAKRKTLSHLRCVIYSWNTVSQLMATRAGFEPTDKIVNDSGEFVIMRKEIA